jgi:TPR repeat protein
MWRIANCVYRAFRNTATHRCPQDVLIPLTTVCNTDDDDDSDQKEKEKCSHVTKWDIYQVLKKNQFSYKNIEKLQEYLQKISIQQFTQKPNVIKQIETPKPLCTVKEVQSISPPKKTEETLDSLLTADQTCMNTVKNLSNLHEETMSIINLQLALEALESENPQSGIETLQASAKNGINAATALYNLGICYGRGIGVEKDRAKACDYYRQASALGHINAQFNLTLLSNHIDINENDDETIELTITEKQKPSLREIFFRFSLSNDYKEDQSFNDDQFDLKNQTIACLS